LPVTIEWLSDNGGCYIAGDTRRFARDMMHQLPSWIMHYNEVHPHKALTKAPDRVRSFGGYNSASGDA
jgi:transposase InsO family protein